MGNQYFNMFITIIPRLYGHMVYFHFCISWNIYDKSLIGKLIEFNFELIDTNAFPQKIFNASMKKKIRAMFKFSVVNIVN